MFDAVIGQSLPKRLLATAIASGKLSHAYIFHGTDGVGKTTLALEFAKAIVCENHTGCGACAACKQFFSTSDFCVLEGESSISVKQIRELTTGIYMNPFQFSKKIYLIKDAEKMTPEAQNALLKVFEEPPRYAVILMVTNAVSALLPTILSRGVKIHCPDLTPKELKEYYEKNSLPVPSDEVLEQANGSVLQAMAVSDSEPYRQMRAAVLRDTGLLFKNRSHKDVVRLYRDFHHYEKEAKQVAVLMASLVYDASVDNPKLRKNTDISEIPGLTLGEASALYTEITGLITALAQRGNYSITVLGALLRMKAHLNEERIL